MNESTFNSYIYPKVWTHAPKCQPIHAICKVPGSKSITNRAMVLAALSAGPTPFTLNGVLQSEDTEVMAQCLQKLGFQVQCNWNQNQIVIQSPFPAGKIPNSNADLFTANSGTTLRFLTAMVSLGNGIFRLDGVERMRERPVGDLLEALEQLGVGAKSEAGNGCPPVQINTSGWKKEKAQIHSETSSQFISGLLLAAPFANREIEFELLGTVVSQPYIEMTIAMLRAWGMQIKTEEGRFFRVPGRQQRQISEYSIEPDASAASYFFAAAAINGGKITVAGLGKKSLQGDLRFVDVLKQMGSNIDLGENETTVSGGKLNGVDVDMNSISDTVMTLGVTACFATGPTIIRNVAHIRHKETDRIRAMAVELRKIGAEVEEREDGLKINPGQPIGAAIDTYNDHRIAMSFALAAMKIPGMIINDPGCVRKTYPGFFDDFSKLLASS